VKSIVKDNRWFIAPYIIFLVLGGVVLLFTSKSDLHLSLNQFHYPFCDVFFQYITYLGDGFMPVIAVIIVLSISYRYALLIGLSNLIASLITQLLKRTVFDDYDRPKRFFEGIHDLYFVPGVDNHLHHTFPSGHTTCAFALYCSLAMLMKQKKHKLACFILALLVGYSRVYLSQHFFIDIYVGSIIGVTTTLMVYYIISKYHNTTLENSLITTFRKQ
jgi:membrane-associated phospholipid phosphatase